jgi:hypothetical protein
MNSKLKSLLLVGACFPVMSYATSSLTVGLGKTDFELNTPTRTETQFTSTDWTDLSFTFVGVSDEGLFFSADYRVAQNGEHTTFTDDLGRKAPSDIDDTRFGLTVGGENFYVGYLSYSTSILAPNGRTSGAGTVTYDLQGFTAGLKFQAALGTQGDVFQYGFGGLMADAELSQDYINSTSSYDASYDSTFGYFYGFGIAGPLGTSGLAYSIKYEVQKINFDAVFDSDAVELDDERSRMSASLTYVFL